MTAAARGRVLIRAVGVAGASPILEVVAVSAEGREVGSDRLPACMTPRALMAAVISAERAYLGGRLADLNLSVRASRTLEDAGITTVAELEALSTEEMLRRGLGRRSIREIGRVLAMGVRNGQGGQR